VAEGCRSIVKGKGGVVNGWQEHGQVFEGKGAWLRQRRLVE